MDNENKKSGKRIRWKDENANTDTGERSPKEARVGKEDENVHKEEEEEDRASINSEDTSAYGSEDGLSISSAGTSVDFMDDLLQSEEELFEAMDLTNMLAISRMSMDELKSVYTVKNAEKAFPFFEPYYPECATDIVMHVENVNRKMRNDSNILDISRHFAEDRSTNTLEEGLARIDRYWEIIYEICEKTGKELIYAQRVATQRMLRARVPKMFGSDFLKYSDIIKRRQNWDRINTRNSISMARRMGKTTVVVINMLAANMVIPKYRSAVFAPSHPQSIDLVNEAAKIAYECFAAYNLHKKKDQLEIRMSKTDVRTMRAYPASINIDMYFLGSVHLLVFLFAVVLAFIAPHVPEEIQVVVGKSFSFFLVFVYLFFYGTVPVCVCPSPRPLPRPRT